ncbi:hypothetical protein JK628_06900 [Shewanella sp. KX20019]|uniref:hypothetical protein n=1 Tax=Shewanella sp. KX20019 TaxID=2803864 RepID=UPI0019291848|nr:hypothetical protein [Shewanella sp. KX20019]QQX81583.1 hypothetical protein JK628_06900 [Shewanella sp. KX20019]
MKAIIISIFLFSISLNIQASESIEGVTTYSIETIKELKIESLSALLVNHFKSNNLNIKDIDTVTYLADGVMTDMSGKEKNNNFLSAETVELLINDKALIVNVISHKTSNE